MSTGQLDANGVVVRQTNVKKLNESCNTKTLQQQNQTFNDNISRLKSDMKRRQQQSDKKEATACSVTADFDSGSSLLDGAGYDTDADEDAEEYGEEVQQQLDKGSMACGATTGELDDSPSGGYAQMMTTKSSSQDDRGSFCASADNFVETAKLLSAKLDNLKRLTSAVRDENDDDQGSFCDATDKRVDTLDNLDDLEVMLDGAGYQRT